MRIYKLTNLAQQLNAALGSGKFQDITSKEVWSRIEDGSIFDYLRDRLDIAVALSTLDPVDRLELLLEWENFRGCVEPFPFNGNRNGLCLLVGYLLASIALRSQNRDYRLTLEMSGAAVPGGELNNSVQA
jgi:hypothetical protein